MRLQELKLAREDRGWDQATAAARFGLSQPYLSMLETGKRLLPPHLARKMARAYGLPTALPVSELSNLGPMDPQTLAEWLAGLGYPGFAHLRTRRRKRNPGEVLLTALAQEDLEARLVEALPWLLLRYWELDTDWLVQQAKLRDLQNRLGFVVALAGRVAQRLDPHNQSRNQALAELEQRLELSRLVREDTLCQASLTEPELRWLRENRPELAQHWNLLTDWRPETLRYVT